MSVIKLQSWDGEVFSVDVEVANQLVTIKTMLVDLEDVLGDDPVPLPNVDGDNLSKIIQWAEHHHKEGDSDTWEKEFFGKLDTDAMFSMIKAANYLDVESLLEALCKAVAEMMEGKGPEDIRVKFNNIEDDLTSEEKEKITNENDWCR